MGVEEANRELRERKRSSRAGGGAEVRSAETHLAGAQVRFAGLGETFGGGKRIRRGAPGQADDRFAKSFAQDRNDLPDLDDLLRRGENERRQAFPRFLAQQPEPAA